MTRSSCSARSATNRSWFGMVVFGVDHPHTLTSASNLARDLSNLGDYQHARDLEKEILARRRQMSGEDHPDAN